MKNLWIVACLLILNCSDQTFIGPSMDEDTSCLPSLPNGAFRAVCIMKDDTNQYVLVNENPTIPDTTLDFPGSIVGFQETPELAAVRGVKEKTGLSIIKICFSFNTSVTNFFNCTSESGVADSQSETILVKHQFDLDGVNFK